MLHPDELKQAHAALSRYMASGGITVDAPMSDEQITAICKRGRVDNRTKRQRRETQVAKGLCKSPGCANRPAEGLLRCNRCMANLAKRLKAWRARQKQLKEAK